MKQLLSQHGDLILVGMKDRVFLLDTSTSETSSSVLELSKPSTDESAPSDPAKQEHQQQTSQHIKDQAELQDITAVAVTSFATSESDATVFCAVSRYDKSLAIYQLRRQENGEWQSEDFKQPHLMYRSPKRVACLTFAGIPAAENDDKNSMQVLITGDLAGDSYAYNLLQKGHRLLLGHTASMMTGVTLLDSDTFIATADRDEKIRISRFPETYIVEGYLLGHTKYVTAIQGVPSKENQSLLVSCGGDKTLRLWNYKTQEELHCVSTTETLEKDSSNDGIPTDLAVSADGKHIAVVFDESKCLCIYKVIEEEDAQVSLSLSATVECPSQPLVVSFEEDSSNRLLVLTMEPQYLTSYTIGEDSDSTTLSMNENIPSLQALKDKAERESIPMPSSILEKDKHGHIVLEKENETRGLTFDVPWKRVERLQTAREKQKKRNQKKRDKKKQKLEQAELSAS